MVAGAISFEVICWRRGVRDVSSKQKACRIAAAVMMECLLLMFLLADKASKLPPLVQIGYWGGAFIIAFAIVAIALLDVREGLIDYSKDRRNAFLETFIEENKKK